MFSLEKYLQFSVEKFFNERFVGNSSRAVKTLADSFLAAILRFLFTTRVKFYRHIIKISICPVRGLCAIRYGNANAFTRTMDLCMEIEADFGSRKALPSDNLSLLYKFLWPRIDIYLENITL